MDSCAWNPPPLPGVAAVVASCVMMDVVSSVVTKPRKTQTFTVRLTDAEAELLRAAADALHTNVTNVMLSGAVALGADISTRWDGPWPPEVLRALKAWERVRDERMPGSRGRDGGLLHQVAKHTEDHGREVSAERPRKTRN